MITDDLFALKAETLKYFDHQAAVQGGALARQLTQLAITECLYAARIITAMGGQSHKRVVLDLGSLIRALAPNSQAVVRAAFVANRELTIALAEQHFSSRRSRVMALADSRKVVQLFDEVVNANHAAINRLRRGAGGAIAPGRGPG
jgi:hypothetical protein